MRILIVSQYYYPEPVEKVHDLARGLMRRGHEVQVLTSFPCYPTGRIYDGYQQQFCFREEIGGIDVLRVPQFPDHTWSPWRRAAYYLSFAASAATIGYVRVNRPDVVLVYQAELPVGLAGWLLALTKRVPCVFDIVDLWPESAMASGMAKSALMLRLIRAAARFIYTRPHFAAAVTEGFKQRLIRMGVPEQKITVIHNWMPAEIYQHAEPDAALAEKEGLDGRFNVMYAGNIGTCQGLQAVVESGALLRDLPEVQLVLIGDGVEYTGLVELAKERRLLNVRFLGRRPPEMMAKLYALADVLLVHLKPDALSQVSIPSKTFAYMASGRPVLMAVEGEAARFVVENGFGIAAPPSDPQEIAAAVRRFHAMSPENRARMSRAGYLSYQNKYCGDVQISRMEVLLARAVAACAVPLARRKLL